MNIIPKFDGEHRFLSNFYPTNNGTLYDGVPYPSSEHAYQAAKFAPDKRRDFLQGSPGNAKRMGRRPGVRSDWEQVKTGIMLEIVSSKFQRDTELRKKLLATGTAVLIEGNTWGDVFWGVCKGTGENWLGRILMTVRQELQENPL